MKNLSLARLFMAALPLALIGTTYADGQAFCEKWVNQYNDVHCTYVSGLASETKKGRYIKHYDSNNNSSHTRCVTSDQVEDDIYQSIAEDYIGTHQVHYFICTDAKGEQCEALGVDTYTIARNGENYVGTPTSYAIDLSAVKSKYPECGK